MTNLFQGPGQNATTYNVATAQPTSSAGGVVIPATQPTQSHTTIKPDGIKQEEANMHQQQRQHIQQQIVTVSAPNTIQIPNSMIVTQQGSQQLTNATLIQTNQPAEHIQVAVNPENSIMIMDTSAPNKNEKIMSNQNMNTGEPMQGIERVKEEKPFVNCKMLPHQQQMHAQQLAPDQKVHIPHLLDVRNADGSLIKIQPQDQEMGKQLGVEMYKVNIEDLSQFLSYHEVFGKLHGGDVITHPISHSGTHVVNTISNAPAAVKTTTAPNVVTSGANITTSTGELLMPKMENITQMPGVNQVPGAPGTLTNADGTTITPATHTCDICGKMFQFRYQLIVHRRYHSERKPFMCQVCGQGFTTSQDLTRHGKIHIGGPMFTCNVCFHVFANDASLERHMKRHSADKPFACTMCQKTFARKEHLDNHFRSHTGETPFRCQFCAKTFTRKEHMVNHVRKHTGETPHRCDICKKSFTRKEHYVNHYMWHTGEL